jgi:hypothetical protein
MNWVFGNSTKDTNPIYEKSMDILVLFSHNLPVLLIGHRAPKPDNARDLHNFRVT